MVLFPPDRTLELQGDIERFCSENPRYRSLYLLLMYMVSNRSSDWFRFLVSVGGGNMISRLGMRRARSMDDSIDILIEPILGNKHQILWSPVAREFTRKGFHVAAVSRRKAVKKLAEGEMREAFARAVISGNFTAPRNRIRSPQGVEIPSGRLGLFVRLGCEYIDRMVAVWLEVLEKTGVKAFLTTAQFSPWTSALIIAGEQLGMTSFSMQQGLPDKKLWQHPTCRCHIVWSDVGREALLLYGVAADDVYIARNPAVPTPEEGRSSRERIRGALRLGNEKCVLVLGQVAEDYFVRDEHFFSQLEILADGLGRLAAKDGEVRFFLRPHYRDIDSQVEKFLLGRSLPMQTLRSHTLYEDIFFSDVVVSTGSTALEEAYLSGASIVQLKPSFDEVSPDFSVLQIPVARDANDLEQHLVEALRIKASPASRPRRETVADAVAGRIGAVN